MSRTAKAWHRHEQYISRKEFEHLRSELQQFLTVQVLMLGASTVLSCAGAFLRVALGHLARRELLAVS